MNGQPSEQSSPEEPKHKRRKWPWIVLAIVIFVPLLVLGWTGLYSIPVVSAIFGTNKPIDLGVKVSAEALASAMRDNPMTLVGDSKTWYGLSKKKYSGSVPIDDVHSSEEVTSFISHYTQGHKYARDIQVKFVEGGMEVSAFVVPVIKAPIYAKVGVTRTGSKSVSITVDKAKVGRLSVPATYYDDIGREASQWINERLAEADGFSLETLEYRDGEAYLKGTLPKTVEQVPGEEYTILGKDLQTL